MEGSLLVPPDKSSILGRSLWKARFVTLGPAPPPSLPPGSRSTSSSSSPSRLNSSLRQLTLGSRNASQASVEQLAAEPLWIFIYKHKGDNDPIARYPVSSITACTIHNYAYRKTSSVQPTLILTLQTTDPKRNSQVRRLSQTSNPSSKARSNTLLFRSVPAAPYSIHDWHRLLQDQLRWPAGNAPLENAFSRSDKSSRPSTSGTRPGLRSQGSHVSTTSSHPGSTLSIRTSQTGVSSPTSVSPPNPLKTFETSSSPLSEEFRASSPRQPESPDSPVAPAGGRQETILDRAFKMNCIPGADLAPASDTAMNSIARFEALMQDLESRRAAERRPVAIDEDGEEEPADVLSSSAQRALEYISSGQSTIHSRKGTARRDRPTSLALPSTVSMRPSPPAPAAGSTPSDGASDRRRSSVSTATSTANANFNNKRLSLAEFHRRLSSTSSLILARTTTTSSRSSGVSDVSFQCVGEDDGGGGSSGFGGSGGGGGGTTWGVATAVGRAGPKGTGTTTTTTTTTIGSGNGSTSCNRLSGGAFGI